MMLGALVNNDGDLGGGDDGGEGGASGGNRSEERW